MSKQLLTDQYQTDENHPRALGDKLSLGTSAYFYWQFLGMILRNRKVALAGQFNTSVWAARSMDIFELIENCGGKFHMSGLENITKSADPVVFVSNHMGTMETMIFPGIIASRREVTFVVKESLERHALFGPVMRARKPIAVERKDPMADFKKVMADGAANLANGTSVVIFPQSQRVTTFDPAQFNTLGIKLAKSTGAPVVPVAIKTDFWKNGTLIKDVGALDRKLPIHIEFGEPFRVQGAGKVEHQQVIEFISGRLAMWS